MLFVEYNKLLLFWNARSSENRCAVCTHKVSPLADDDAVEAITSEEDEQSEDTSEAKRAVQTVQKVQMTTTKGQEEEQTMVI